jgi:acyl-CoA dehydrogenase
VTDRDLIVGTVRNMLESACAPQQVASVEGSWQSDLWNTLAELGVTAIGVPEEAGGVGGTIADAVAVVRVAAEFAAAVPLAETLLASWILADSDLPLPVGAATIASAGSASITRTDCGYHVSGHLRRVPWASVVSTLVIADEAEGVVAGVPTAACSINLGKNLAGEPCDDVSFDEDVDAAMVGTFPARWDNGGISRLGALMRAAQMAGALTRILSLTTEYVGQREQFGRPIVAFQAVQQQLAELAGKATAVGVGVEAAAEAAPGPARDLAIEAVKAYTSAASGRAAAIAHQLHGAIGLTEEHQLHLFTRRLWSWRDDFGNERDWGARIAARLTAAGADQVWPVLTSTEAIP